MTWCYVSCHSLPNYFQVFVYFDKVKMITITTCADMFPNVNRQSWFETINWFLALLKYMCLFAASVFPSCLVRIQQHELAHCLFSWLISMAQINIFMRLFENESIKVNYRDEKWSQTAATDCFNSWCQLNELCWIKNFERYCWWNWSDPFEMFFHIIYFVSTTTVSRNSTAVYKDCVWICGLCSLTNETFFLSMK